MQKIRLSHPGLPAVYLNCGMTIRFIMLSILLTSSLLIYSSMPVAAGGISPKIDVVQTSPTPTPPFNDPEQTSRTSPIVGILVLLAPLVFLVWKSRGLKEPKVTGSCCAPVIDENKRPFRIEED